MINDSKPRIPLQIDMNADGSFRAPYAAGQSPGGAPGPLSTAILRWAIIIAGVATLGAFALLALWLAISLIPIAIGAGLIAYGALRYRIWKAGGAQRFRR
jgi:hypothetical protein